MVEGSNSMRSIRKTFEFFGVKKVVQTCFRCAQPCAYIYPRIRKTIRNVKDPVVHVTVRWIMETPKITTMHL